MTTRPEIDVVDRYDRKKILTRLRDRRARAAQARGSAHRKTEIHAKALARSLVEDLPGVPPETIGEVLLCVASLTGAMHVDGMPFGQALNVLAYTADDLIGTVTEQPTGPGRR